MENPEHISGVLDKVFKELNDKQIERGEIMKEKKEVKCDHKDYEEKRVMDFSFYVCKKCGYQWKK